MTYICDRMKLHKHNAVRERHETNEHKIHADRDNSQTSVVSNQWLVLSKAVLLDQSGLDDLVGRILADNLENAKL